MAEKEKVEKMGKVEIALAVAQLLPWEKLVDKAPEIMREARGLLPSFKWKNKSNALQKLTVETLSENIIELEGALEEQAKLLAEMTEQSAGMIAKIKELEDANQQLSTEQRAMSNKLNFALGLSLISIAAAAATILR